MFSLSGKAFEPRQNSELPSRDSPIAIIGLGYVGLPLIIEILKASSDRTVIGFDNSASKIEFLSSGSDLSEFGYSGRIDSYSGTNTLILTSELSLLSEALIYIVSVPTPIDSANNPDLSCVEDATKAILSANIPMRSRSIKIIIYESTVYPGATREVFESISSLYPNSDQFKIGYSPERINPGDNSRGLTDIVKVTSGEDPATAEWVDCFYKKLIKAGTFKAASIEVAEAAKSFENTQRDLNIALVNELALICSRLGIATVDVLDAASTKWNFLDFKPGLVGGHCIGVDPYYLAYKAQQVGIHPQVILSGRCVNDGMPGWVSRKIIKTLISTVGSGKTYECLIMGVTYKENCKDTRNSKSIEMAYILRSFGIDVTITDPILGSPDFAGELTRNFNCAHLEDVLARQYDCVVISVSHSEYLHLGLEDYRQLLKDNAFIFDLKDVIKSTLPNLIKL